MRVIIVNLWFIAVLKITSELGNILLFKITY